MITVISERELVTPREQVEAAIFEALDLLIENAPAGSGYTYSSTTGRLAVALPNGDGDFAEDVELFFRPEVGA